MAVEDNRLLVADYINYRLEKAGLHWIACPALPESGHVQKTLRTLGTEFEQRYKTQFDEMCGQLHITESTAQSTFTRIMNEVFADGIRWGRVIALFSFGGCMAVQCMEKEMPRLVMDIVDWVTFYINTQLRTWISEQGSWDGMVRFYETSPANRQEDSWPSVKTLFGYAGCAVGLLTLGAIISHKT